MKKARLGSEDEIIVKFSGGSNFKKILKTIQDLKTEDRRLINSTKEWVLKYSDEVVEMLHGFNFDLSDDLFIKWNNSEIDEDWKSIPIGIEYDYLFDYQKDAVRYSEYHANRMLLTLEMGGGKSITSLSIMDKLEDFPTVIITPSIVKRGFKKEYEKFIAKNDIIKIVESSKEMLYYADEVDIVVINYELLARNMVEVVDSKGNDYLEPTEVLKEFKSNYFLFAVVDEIHRIKNLDTKTYGAIQYLLEDVKHIIALTGTPLISSHKDLFPVLNLLKPELFSNYWKFCNRYCYSRVTSHGKEFYGARNSLELHTILVNNGMFRRTKEEMGKVVDKPLVSVIPLPLADPDKYFDLAEELNDSEVGLFEKVNKLGKEAWEQKKESFFERVDAILLETSDGIVIFAHNKIVVQDIQEKYSTISVKIDGDTSTKGAIREDIVNKFVNDPKIRIFIGSERASGTGLDGLQHGSSTVLMVQWPWVDSEVQQCVSRVHRTGQTKMVNVIHFPAGDTIEEIFMQILDKKAKMAKGTIDNEELSEKDMLDNIMQLAKRKLERRHR